MLNKIKGVMKDDRGSAFIENGLWIIVVVLIVAGAGYTLANQGISPKLDNIQTTIKDVKVPDIGQNIGQ